MIIAITCINRTTSAQSYPSLSLLDIVYRINSSASEDYYCFEFFSLFYGKGIRPVTSKYNLKIAGNTSNVERHKQKLLRRNNYSTSVSLSNKFLDNEIDAAIYINAYEIVNDRSIDRDKIPVCHVQKITTSWMAKIDRAPKTSAPRRSYSVTKYG